MNKKPSLKKLLIAAGILLLAAFIVMRAVGKKVQVSAYTVQPKNALETVLATGTVAGKHSVLLSFNTAGKIENVFAEEGDTVDRGFLCVQMDDRSIKNRLLQAESELDVSKANLEKLKTSDVETALQRMKQAEVMSVFQKSLYEKQVRVFQQGGVSGLEVETSKKDMDLSLSQFELAKIEYQKIISTQKTLSEAQVRQAEITVRDAEYALSHTQIRAPDRGVILERYVRKDEFVTVGQKVMLFNPCDSVTHIEIQGEENVLGQVFRAQKARVSSEAFPGKMYEASIDRIAPFIDQQRGTFKVRLQIDERVPGFVTDLSVSVQIVTDSIHNELIIPQRYLYRESDSSYVYLIRDARAYKQAVAVRGIGSGLFIVAGGLSSGAEICQSPKLRHGMKVAVREREE